MSESSSTTSVVNTGAPFPKMSRRLRRTRHLKDSIARWSIGFGGVSVIFAVCLIFFYLVYEVMPLFRSAEIVPLQKYDSVYSEAENYNPVLRFGVEEQNEIAYSFQKNGQINFFDAHAGQLISQSWLSGLSDPTQEVQLLATSGINQLFAAVKGTEVLFFKLTFDHLFDEFGQREIIPKVDYPYGNQWLTFLDSTLEFAGPVDKSQSAFAVRDLEESILVAIQADDSVYIKRFSKESELFGEDVELEGKALLALPKPAYDIQDMFIGPDQRWLYLVEAQGNIEIFDLWNNNNKRHSIQSFPDKEVTAAKLLLGGNSLLVGFDNGTVAQLTMIRDDNNEYKLTQLREFYVSQRPITNIKPEERRKGFLVTDDQGLLVAFNSTSERRLLDINLVEGVEKEGVEKEGVEKEGVEEEGVEKEGVEKNPLELDFALSPRANFLLSFNTTDQQFQAYRIKNEHPELSWSSIWNEVWYEGYSEPEYIWQSSAANNDFEPKYSLVPLAFGTLKAAFYAMLLAVPLAICGAVYTAYFMAPTLRSKVKPAVELMEALPTVILGFLAGLWLAPLLEDKLPGVFALLILVPTTVLLFSFLWLFVPSRFRHAIDNGWQPLVLVPLIIFASALAMMASESLETWLFGGNIRGWLTNEMGIGYDQRNALVVGLAMGFAVIPTIFSIAEDALFAVPKHLSFGSLALGASPWQTVTRVVLPTASPGIFSAVMIGFGRAVGETMIVLMATGNTPIMEMNIFEGLRTLSANIAVEMPEAEKDSTHYRILFLAALVLFLFTFMFNTSAEIVRQRLREKYGTL